MKYSTAKQGRVFIIRLEQNDIIHECIERVAREEGLQRAVCIALGGADDSSRLIVGPETRTDDIVVPQRTELIGAHEYGAVGTIFPDENGQPVLHMHAACGRGASSRVGCIREGVSTWMIGEVVIIELLDSVAARVRDPATGFGLLEPHAAIPTGQP